MAKNGTLEAARDIPWAPNASVTELVYDRGAWVCAKANIAEHLGALKTELPKNV